MKTCCIIGRICADNFNSSSRSAAGRTLPVRITSETQARHWTGRVNILTTVPIYSRGDQEEQEPAEVQGPMLQVSLHLGAEGPGQGREAETEPAPQCVQHPSLQTRQSMTDYGNVASDLTIKEIPKKNKRGKASA
jgi:hypothetical protein